MLQLFDGVSRRISIQEPSRMKKDNGTDGIQSIHNLSYTIQDEYINVERFDLPISAIDNTFYNKNMMNSDNKVNIYEPISKAEFYKRQEEVAMEQIPRFAMGGLMNNGQQHGRPIQLQNHSVQRSRANGASLQMM